MHVISICAYLLSFSLFFRWQHNERGDEQYMQHSETFGWTVTDH